MGHNGRLQPHLMVQTTRRIVEDHYAYIQVFRGRRGSEQPIEGFRTRIAAVDTATLSRDVQRVLGDTAPQAQIIYAPVHSQVQKGDEVWADGQRYRAIAVDHYPGNTQIIAQHIQ